MEHVMVAKAVFGFASRNIICETFPRGAAFKYASVLAYLVMAVLKSQFSPSEKWAKTTICVVIFQQNLPTFHAYLVQRRTSKQL
eukprot:4184807-Amphidinium_carterae.1